MCSTPEETPLQRLFFALWPPPRLVPALVDLVRCHTPPRARPTPPANLHVTLAFVGPVQVETRACLERVAATVRGESFELVLECLGAWPGPGILWLAPAQPPAALLRLVADLGRALQACGYDPEPRPYRPHVTLARKLGDMPPATTVPPLRWPVRDFVLAESVTGPEGPRYRVLARWPLTG